jgi:predicted transcriptional regulator
MKTQTFTSSSETLTARVPADLKKQLNRLANYTKRTRSCLASEAIADYVDREWDFIEGIERGLEDMRAARVVPHSQAMRRFKKTIARAGQKMG